MATFSSWRPGTLGNSIIERFFDEYIPCVVAYERSYGPLMLYRRSGRASFQGAGHRRRENFEDLKAETISRARKQEQAVVVQDDRGLETAWYTPDTD
jgi:hypothetical protein